MRMTLALVLLLLTCCVGANVFKTGYGLHNECNNESSKAQSYCLGFVTGVAEVLDSNAVNGYSACVPNKVNQGEVRDIVVKFLEDHPELRHYEAHVLIARALSEAFPCLKK